MYADNASQETDGSSRETNIEMKRPLLTLRVLPCNRVPITGLFVLTFNDFFRATLMYPSSSARADRIVGRVSPLVAPLVEPFVAPPDR